MEMAVSLEGYLNLDRAFIGRVYHGLWTAEESVVMFPSSQTCFDSYLFYCFPTCANSSMNVKMCKQA